MVMKQYNNACLDVTGQATPDPWVYQANGRFYLTFTGNNRIPMWDVSSLTDLNDRAKTTRGPVWRCPWTGPQSERLWAPELHALRGRWYIYFAGADAAKGNRSHRMYVLGGPSADRNPHQGPWKLLGPIKGMDQRQWAIDGTVFELDDGEKGTRELFFVYSGWPIVGDEKGKKKYEEKCEKVQQLFIHKLKDPVTAEGEAIMISAPTNEWEKLPGTDVAINEAPQWLESPSKHWRGLVFSCSASWTKHEKMATLRYCPEAGKGPLDPCAWRKSDEPLIQNREDGIGPYGPGHGCFLTYGGETMALFHATEKETDGSSNRRCRMQRVRWNEDGPDMGGCVGMATADAEVFEKGEAVPRGEVMFESTA